ncbi:hypothetical protein BJF90_31305 [Pseudonocardia sp. CNS-004]|nr:hypothetical protein BJF90_31305 [Pseudonocardia sp. CNS-004]
MALPRPRRRGDPHGAPRRLVRINVRAKDLRRPQRRDAVLAAVDAALGLGATPTTYHLTAAASAA